MIATGKVPLVEFLGTSYLCCAGIAAILCSGRTSGTRKAARRGQTPLTFVSARDC
jgi:hypothetical protein